MPAQYKDRKVANTRSTFHGVLIAYLVFGALFGVYFGLRAAFEVPYDHTMNNRREGTELSNQFWLYVADKPNELDNPTAKALADDIDEYMSLDLDKYNNPLLPSDLTQIYISADVYPRLCDIFEPDILNHDSCENSGYFKSSFVTSYLSAREGNTSSLMMQLPKSNEGIAFTPYGLPIWMFVGALTYILINIGVALSIWLDSYKPLKLTGWYIFGFLIFAPVAVIMVGPVQLHQVRKINKERAKHPYNSVIYALQNKLDIVNAYLATYGAHDEIGMRYKDTQAKLQAAIKEMEQFPETLSKATYNQILESDILPELKDAEIVKQTLLDAVKELK